MPKARRSKLPIEFTADKLTMWDVLPQNNNEQMDDKVVEQLQEAGRMMKPSDLESYNRQVRTTFHGQDKRLGRMPYFRRTRDGQVLLSRAWMDLGHMDRDPLFAPPSSREPYRRNPVGVEKEMDFVDIVAKANQSAQDRQDMFLTARQRQTRMRRIRRVF